MTQFDKDNPRESTFKESANIRVKKKILLLEPDKEQAELLSGWLNQEGYGVTVINNLQEVQPSLSNGGFDILLMDCDDPAIGAGSLEIVRALKTGERFKDLPIAVLVYRKDIQKITAAVEAGVDIFMLKPFETGSFLKRVETVFKELEFKPKGNKVIDLNYINYLIALAGEMEREGFFALSAVIFNKLIIEKINTILGPLVITQIIKRANETIGMDYEFMKSVEFLNGRLSLGGVDNASKEAPVEKITIAFRDYVYAFLHIVRMLTSDILMERGE